MGCFQSKKEVSDLHPNVFRVVNIDENGSDLCTGQLEITDTDIILYREGRESTIWPLHSLRRYGFEGEIFSFESGRRCETGEGIYAFKCRRASLLFQTLQHKIQLRNVVHDAVPYPVSRLTPSPQGRQTLQASVVHRSSLDNGQPENIGSSFNNNISNIAASGLPVLTQSPPSPSSADILEVTPLYPRPLATTNHVANVYEVRDFKREHNNNQTESTLDNRHSYTNDFNRDLAMLRKTLKQENALNTIKYVEDETYFIENKCINENNPNSSISPLSPTISNSSEHYAQLSIEQQQEQKQEQHASRLYVNIPPDDINVFDVNKSVTIPNTPPTPKQVEYCNVLVGTKAEINSYANLMIGEITDSNISNKSFINKSDQQKSNQKFSESDTTVSLSPIEDIEVNYAILDMDINKETTKAAREAVSPDNSSKHESAVSCSSQVRGRVVSQASADHDSPVLPAAAIGYTTIDFEKTVAFTSVIAGTESNLDGCRKNRNNSSGILCGSPGILKRLEGITD